MLKKFAHGFALFEKWCLTILFMLAFVVIMLQGIFRYFFNSPLIWTDEVSTMLQMLIAFLGIGYGIRTKSHIKVDGLLLMCPKTVQRLLSILFNVIIIVLCVVMIRDGFAYAMREWNVSFGTFAFDRGKAFLAVPIGYGLALIYTVFNLVDDFCRLIHRDPIFNLHAVDEDEAAVREVS